MPPRGYHFHSSPGFPCYSCLWIYVSLVAELWCYQVRCCCNCRQFKWSFILGNILQSTRTLNLHTWNWETALVSVSMFVCAYACVCVCVCLWRWHLCSLAISWHRCNLSVHFSSMHVTHFRHHSSPDCCLSFRSCQLSSSHLPAYLHTCTPYQLVN